MATPPEAAPLASSTGVEAAQFHVTPLSELTSFDKAALTLSPVSVPLAEGPDLPVIAFYCPHLGLTEWDRKTGGAPLGNFWPLDPHWMILTHNGVSGTFQNSEAAYQSMKWWQHEATRKAFEDCNAPGFAGGGSAYTLKKACEATEALNLYKDRDFDGLGKFGAMLEVLRVKWRLPGFKELLLKTGSSYLVEHCEVPDRDPYWTDNYHGGGENRLGCALMLVRSELLSEERGSDATAAKEILAWPSSVNQPEWAGGKFENNWQDVVDEVARYLVQHTEFPPLTA